MSIQKSWVSLDCKSNNLILNSQFKQAHRLLIYTWKLHKAVPLSVAKMWHFYVPLARLIWTGFVPLLLLRVCDYVLILFPTNRWSMVQKAKPIQHNTEISKWKILRKVRYGDGDNTTEKIYYNKYSINVQ